jgi:hypothetical protein
MSVENGIRTFDNSGSKIFYDALLAVDVPCSVSDTFNRVLYAVHLVVVGVYSYAFVCPGYGRRTRHRHRVDVICRLTCRVVGI